MNQTPPDLPRIRALLALRQLSPALASDALADGTIARRFSLSLIRPTRLSENLTVSSDALFEAFRAAVAGTIVPPIVDQDGAPLNATVRIGADGAGIVEADGKGWRFPNAALLAEGPDSRLAALNAALAGNTINTRDAAALRGIVARSPFSNDDFVEVIEALTSSPDAFAAGLRAKISIGQVGEDDLLPTDIRHWDHLAAPIGQSASLSDFIDNELAREREDRLSTDPVSGFATVALTFAAPALVPRALLLTMHADRVAGMIERSLQFEDHFGTVGSFEMCSDRATDARFIALGDQLLDRLLGDRQRLKNSCGIFEAAFVLATMRLATHEILRHRPVFWRRLAAASHASLIVRACGVSNVGDKELPSWAMGIAGQEYVLSVLNDMSVEPNWRPEWVDSRFLMADAFGRVCDAFGTLSTAIAPQSWKQRIERAKKWVEEDHLDIIMRFPAVLQGAPRDKSHYPPEAKEALQRASNLFSRDPSIDNLLRITAITEALGVPDGIGEALKKIIEQVRSTSSSIDHHTLHTVLTILAHIAIQTKDVTLANAISDLCVELAIGFGDHASLQLSCYRLVECAAANPDHVTARSGLAERFESLALRLPPSRRMAGFAVLLETLQKVAPEIAPMLGRATAAAKLAASRATA